MNYTVSRPLMSCAVLAILLAGASFVFPAKAETPKVPCKVSADLVRLAQPLVRVAHKLAAGDPVTIVALGSSSTAGAGASSPAMSYPSQLAGELSRQFPGQKITVVNRGVNGEEAKEMLARFDESVKSAAPDLVIWQVGTNAVLRDHPLAPALTLVHDGVKRMKAIGADVVLLDPQFAPKVLAKTDARGMVDLISTAAKEENVDLFPRFAVMRAWHQTDGLPFEAFVDPDGLHMNDWGYGCLAKGIGVAITEAATRPTLSATASFH